MKRGFTLIELVISAAVMSIILVGAYACLSSGVASQKMVEARADIVQSARVALGLMSADLRCACPLSRDVAFLGMQRVLGEVEVGNLDFATRNYAPRRLREGDFCAVSYFLEKDLATGKFSLWRRRNPRFAPDPLAGGSREEIARGVQGLRFEYYDGFNWYSEWGDLEHRGEPRGSLQAQANLSGLPEAVRITLWFDPNPAPLARVAIEEKAAEPPLVFQTVARLNLASLSAGEGVSASPQAGSGGGPASSQQPSSSGGQP